MNATHRIGLLVPSSNTTMETEIPWLLRERERERPEESFTVHSARMRMANVRPEELRVMNAQTERATNELADMRPNVVASACLVAIMAQELGHHRVVQAEIESISSASTHVRRRSPRRVPWLMRFTPSAHGGSGSSLPI